MAISTLGMLIGLQQDEFDLLWAVDVSVPNPILCVDLVVADIAVSFLRLFPTTVVVAQADNHKYHNDNYNYLHNTN